LFAFRRWYFWGCIALAALAYGVGSRANRSWPELRFHSIRSINSSNAEARTPRKVYRYSVVPGGVYTTAEFEQARRSDPVVAAHYAVFGPKVSLTKLTKDMYVYVSYRKANHVYWSTKKHKVCEGESIVTDGKNMARSRCGNRLSFVPYHPSLDVQEPHERDLDIDEPLVAKLPEGPLFSPSVPGTAIPEQYPVTPAASPYATPARSGATSPFAAPMNFIGPLTPIGIGGGPFFVPPADNGGTPNSPPGGVVPPPGGGVTPVPEPQNALLFLLTAAGAGGLLLRRRV
jgi:hypothetical protein